MTVRISLALYSALLIWFFAPPLLAHHSFGAEFDSNKPVVLTGVVTKIEWTNPHSHIYLDVKDDRGRLAHWRLEGPGRQQCGTCPRGHAREPDKAVLRPAGRYG